MKRKIAGAVLCAVFLLCTAGASVYCLQSSRTAATAPSEGEHDPKATVETFFESLNSKNYDACSGCLFECSSLGLENEPEDETEKFLWEKMRSSYSFEFDGDVVIEADTAVINVSVTGLSLSEASAAVNKTAKKMIDDAMKEPDSTEAIFDENGEYLETFIMSQYDKAARAVLATPEEYFSSVRIEMILKYTDGEWKITVTDELAGILTGSSFM